jgi:hypothetical protein
MTEMNYGVSLFEITGELGIKKLARKKDSYQMARFYG